MSFVESITTVLTKYCDFSGRARRSEFWWFYLANIILSSVLSGLGRGSSIVMVISVIVSLALLLPELGVGVRRLHDIGKSGWNLLFGLIPIVGFILLIIWFCKDSEPGDNQYGPNPKGM